MEKRKRRIRRILKLAGTMFLLVVIFAAIDYWAYPYGASIAGRSSNKGESGLWLRYWRAYSSLWLG